MDLKQFNKRIKAIAKLNNIKDTKNIILDINGIGCFDEKNGKIIIQIFNK